VVLIRIGITIKIRRARLASDFSWRVNMTVGIGGSSAARELSEMRVWGDLVPKIGRGEREARLEKAHRLMGEEGQGVDAFLIGAGPNLRYFAGVPWGASERLVGMVVPRDGRPVMIAPAFEAGTLAADLDVDAEVRLWEEDESPAELVAGVLKEWKVSTLAIDPAMAMLHTERVRRAAAGVKITDASAIVDGCRMIKSAAELALLQQAKNMTYEVQRRTARILREGITATEVKRFIEDAHRLLGAAGSSFCIVQFGRSTAFPHGLPGECVLREGDVVIVDITRTYVFGKANPEQRRIWELEKEAQQAAFDAVRPGVACEEIDAAARQVLEKAGLGPGYKLPGLPHRTGHGIGLSIHEPVYLVKGEKTPLAPGMCFSDEPMIVVPERFGVRLEDHLHVTETGAEWFTTPSRSVEEPFG
jgi:Xaa-Pro dipeptidase